MISPRQIVPAILVLIVTFTLARAEVTHAEALIPSDYEVATGKLTPLRTYTLTLGSTDASTAGVVSVWQTFLVRQAEGQAAVALKAAFDRGIPKGYFGVLTGMATEEWQAAKGITPTAPVVGPKTRVAVLGSPMPPRDPNPKIRITFIDASNNQPIASKLVRLEQPQITCVTAPCPLVSFFTGATDVNGILAVSPDTISQFPVVVIDGFEQYAFPASPTIDAMVRLNGLSTNPF